jgi:hypothetical protein
MRRILSVASGGDVPMSRRCVDRHRERGRVTMRLGKVEAKGFIEEPVELSTASHDPIESRREEERPVAQQDSPRTASEDEPTPTA